VIRRRTIRTINTLGAEVELRAARIGLSLTEVARRMGITSAGLTHAFTRATVGEAFFLRLTRALGMRAGDWSVPLPARPSRAEILERMQANVAARNGTEKTERSRKSGGGSGPSC